MHRKQHGRRHEDWSKSERSSRQTTGDADVGEDESHVTRQNR